MKMVTFSDEQFERLLKVIESRSKPRKGTFVTFDRSYNGERDFYVLDSFLNVTNLFKKLEHIPDEDALNEVSYLLKGEALLWWQKTKESTVTWDEFCEKIRDKFAPTKLPYMIYQDIMTEKQAPDVTTFCFVIRKRMQFSYLPEPRHTEEQQIDMIYWLLLPEIQEKVPRTTFDTFDQLYSAAREAEMIMEEKKKLFESAGNSSGETSRKRRCSYCRLTGHAVEVCRKKMKGEKQEEPGPYPVSTADAAVQVPCPLEPKFWCYGCGAPNIARANCPKCRDKLTPESKNVSFW